MMNIEVNYVAVLVAIFVASVLSMIAGFLWYSPFLFGKTWMKLMGITQESIKKAPKEMGKMYLLSYILALITAYVLYHVITLSLNYSSYSKMTTGITTAFWMWLGFVMPVQATGVIFGKEKGEGAWKLFAINTGYQLAALLLMGVAIGW